MGKITKIEWTRGPDGTPGATWNPWYGCSKVSPACENCYVERWAKRSGKDFSVITRASKSTFYAPLKWKEPRRIFVCSLSDIFHENVCRIHRSWYIEIFNIMRNTPWHTYMLLTKRPENLKRCPVDFCRLPNVWAGVTVEHQKQAEKRLPLLVESSAKVKFMSCEPLLEEISFPHPLMDSFMSLSWVICGGESGPKARIMRADWARHLRRDCSAMRIPFFMKQMSGKENIPKDLLIREYPVLKE